MINNTSKKLILVVDDTPDNILVLGDILRSKYEVKAAPRGEKALQIANADPKPDMILLDIMMPVMDGYEVCRRLKADAATANIPVIFITAKNEVSDEQIGFEVGAVDYITKPVSPPRVLARVATHIELAEKRRNLEELLQKTLVGTISVLTDLLAISNPTVFARASRLRRFMHGITGHLQLPDAWQYDMAAMLSQIGCVGMPKDTLERLVTGAKVTESDRRQYREQFGRSARILNKIPHLKNVAQMLELLKEEYGTQTTIPPVGSTDAVTLGARLLNTVLYYDDHLQKINNTGEAPQEKRPTAHTAIDAEALNALEPPAAKRQKPNPITFSELQLGMVVEENVYTSNGLCILPKGIEVTEVILEHLNKFRNDAGLVEPLIVSAR